MTHPHWLRTRLRQLLFPTRYATPQNLAGKRIIVTGASPKSLGLATAQVLADWGAAVTITSRSLETAQSAVAMTPVTGTGQLIPEELDLSQSASVRNFVERYRNIHGSKLDVLLNNAGIHLDLLSRWDAPRLTEDGHEIHWRINYLGTYQLTQLLLPMLRATAQQTGDARVVTVVSQLHTKGRNKDFFSPPEKYNSWVAYGTSKLALMHMSQDIHRLYKNEGLTASSLHPGAVYTQVASRGLQEAPYLSRLRNALAPVERLFMNNAIEGAQTSLHCATNPDAISGGYFRKCMPATCSTQCAESDVSANLKNLTERQIPTG